MKFLCFLVTAVLVAVVIVALSAMFTGNLAGIAIAIPGVLWVGIEFAKST